MLSEKLKTDSSWSVKESSQNGGSDHIAAQTLTFRDLATATKNFRADCLLGEGGFGRVYKGHLESTNQVCQLLNIVSVTGNRQIVFKLFKQISHVFILLLTSGVSAPFQFSGLWICCKLTLENFLLCLV